MSLIMQLLDIYSLIIVASALMSWFPVPRDNPVVRFMEAVTEPVYRPIRSLISPNLLGGIDISPIIVLLIIRMIKQLLWNSAF